MKYLLNIFLLFFLTTQVIEAQVINSEEPKTVQGAVESVYKNPGEFYPVKIYPQKFKSSKPKNVILMIGDGMGVTTVSAGITANGGSLFLDNFKHIGFSKTQSANKYVTDSSAGGTAIAIGQKTNNGRVGLNAEKDTINSILKVAQLNGLATGIVNVNGILDATPAAFFAHNITRKDWEGIAAQMVDSDIDVLIGGDSEKFIKRADNRDLYKELEKKGYEVFRSKETLKNASGNKVACLMPYGRISERDDQLQISTTVALKTLAQHPKTKDKGFFMMIEGSYIDGGGHKNDMTYLMEEMLDFDQAIGKVLAFAAEDGETLVIITADHETGGVSLVGGDKETGTVTGRFNTVGHTGVMVPVFAYGPGAEAFTGINENTFFFDAIVKVLGLTK